MTTTNDGPPAHAPWIPAIISALVSIGLAAGTTAVQLRDQSANLRERAADLEARINGLQARADVNAKANERQEDGIASLRTALAETRSEARALEARLRVIETWSERTQANRFTDRDAERLTQSLEVRLDELRRRIIQLEQAVFNRNLDGAVQHGGPR